MRDEDIERLESKIAYLEQANNELSNVVYRQQRELDDLRLRLLALKGQLESSKPGGAPFDLDSERPPHY